MSGSQTGNIPNDMNFLAFFDNGADISWSIWQWIYKLYVEDAGGPGGNRIFNGVSYDLYRTVYAADDNKTIENQTRPACRASSAQASATRGGCRRTTVRWTTGG